MNYEIANMTYSPMPLILADGTDAIIDSRATQQNTITVSAVTDQIQALADKGWLRIRALSTN